MNDSMTFSQIQSVLRWIEEGNVRKIMIGEFTNLLVSLFRLRDCRDVTVGVGRRDEFYDAFIRLYATFPHTMTACLPLIPVYGYWKDYMNILLYAKEMSADAYDTLKDAIYEELVRTMLSDAVLFYRESVSGSPASCRVRNVASFILSQNMDIQPSQYISLCSKWMPRENGRADRLIGNVVRDISAKMFPSVSGSGERCRLYRRLCRMYSVTMEDNYNHRRLSRSGVLMNRVPSIATVERLRDTLGGSSSYSFDAERIVNECVSTYVFQNDVFNTPLNMDSIYYENWLERSDGNREQSEPLESNDDSNREQGESLESNDSNREQGESLESNDSNREQGESLETDATPNPSNSAEAVELVERYEIIESNPTEKTLTERLLSVFWG